MVVLASGTGKYRRVRFDDLMAYKRKDDEARAKILGKWGKWCQFIFPKLFLA